MNHATAEPGLDARSAAGCELAAEVLRRFGAMQFRAQGASMLPCVQPGDILTVRRQTVRNLRHGEIVLAQRGRQLVAHRIVGKAGGAFITRRDCLSENDAPFEEHEVPGRVVAITRGGRAVSLRLTLRQRLALPLLRRSELSIRVLLRWKSLAACALRDIRGSSRDYPGKTWSLAPAPGNREKGASYYTREP